MENSLNQSTANISYHHKKFDGRKRFQDEEARQNLEQVNDKHSPGAVDLLSQPFSDDSDYADFVKLFSASSTPYKKTRNPNGDSGIFETPQKQQPHETPLLRRTKRKLNLSSLAESPSEQQSTEKQQPEAISPTISALELPTGSKSATNTTTSLLPDIDTSLLSLINKNKLRRICAYHGNMVRSCPKKERSPEDQERRDKNTIACRLSHRVEQLAIGEHHEQMKKIYNQMVEVIVRGNEYIKYLNKIEPEDVLGAADGSCNAEVVLPAQPVQHAPSRFFIADILGIPNEPDDVMGAADGSCNAEVVLPAQPVQRAPE